MRRVLTALGVVVLLLTVVIPGDAASYEGLKAKIEKELGKSNLTDESRVISITYEQKIDSLVINIRVNDNLTASWIEGGWWDDAWEVFQVAYEDSSVKSDVVVVGYFPVDDKYGNTYWTRVGIIALLRSDYKKINKNNFIPSNLPEIGAGAFDLNGF